MRQTGARTYFIRSAYFIQEECIMKTLYKNIALFVGGSLFGSAGIKLFGLPLKVRALNDQMLYAKTGEHFPSVEK